MEMADALMYLKHKSRLYVTDRCLGADSNYALPIRTVTCHALTSLFTHNMFRPIREKIEQSVFHGKQFTLVVVPYVKLKHERYKGRLRKKSDGTTTDMMVAMDFDRLIGVIIGSSYLGSTKKLMFTVMNYLLPEHGVLPLHASATEGPNGDCALFLGLSGTGKTTLSADPKRSLLGDDEHGWSDNGISNFEYGCYAKLIDLSKEKEPEIFNAVMHEDNFLNHGVICENVMMYPNGKFNFSDSRLTPNSRASYPLSYLTNIKESSVSSHPKTILFLTADANGVIPPISKLNHEQAMLWFLMGYTSKLAGTEMGIVEPVSTFSRFFGGPFMPGLPEVYDRMLGEKLRKHGTMVYLLNTGWIGAPYGAGKRIDIDLTRKMVDAALNGALEDVEYHRDPIFRFLIPEECPGVPSHILNTRELWTHPDSYRERALRLSHDFQMHFEKAYGKKNIEEEIIAQCPA
jgi:phosphoenolpyruvate carboxykinase (ATP)